MGRWVDNVFIERLWHSVKYEEIYLRAYETVALSVLLHGLTAAPLARRYAQGVARMGECEEIQPALEISFREGPPRAGASTAS